MVKGTLSHPSPTPPSLPLCLLFAIRLPGAGCEVPNDLSPKINPISPHGPSFGCLGSLGVEGWGQTDGHGGGGGPVTQLLAKELCLGGLEDQCSGAFREGKTTILHSLEHKWSK